MFGDEITLLITNHDKREIADITDFVEELEQNGSTEDLILECAWSLVNTQALLNNLKKKENNADYLIARKNEMDIIEAKFKAYLPIRDQPIYCDLQKTIREFKKHLNHKRKV